MMEEPEIKHAFYKIEEDICRACLSVGRKLFPLGEFTEIYLTLGGYSYQHIAPTEQTQVCWECHALLHRVHQFRSKVRRANEILQLGQSYVYGSLSTLATVTLNDAHPHTIYVNNQANIQTVVHTDVIKSENDTNDENLDDIIESLPDLETSIVEIGKETRIDAKSENNHGKKLKTNNRWAKTRALENKKPKFKIVDEIAVRRVQIDTEELIKCIERERDSEHYKMLINKCDKCVIGFNDEASLRKHNKKLHEQNLPYTCDICTATFASKRLLSSHIGRHYARHMCRHKRGLCRHKKEGGVSRQATVHQMFQCLKCGLKFGGRREFFKHYKEWHEKFICDYCGISFKMRYCIVDHIRRKHSPYACAPCGKQFSRYNGLWLHRKTRHGARAAAYCVECDRRYEDVYRYRWHLANSARHTPRKKLSIPCPGCDKVFTKKIYMKDHYNLVHLKQYKYRCEECDKNFIRNADLVKHKRRVHEGILPPKNKICYMCGRGFTTNKILTNHLRTHTGERPFACDACPARFAQSTALVGDTRALHHA